MLRTMATTEAGEVALACLEAMAWEATESALMINTSLVEGGSVIRTSMIVAMVAVVVTSMVE